MTKEMIHKIHRIYNKVLSVVIVIAGICLITACLGIYQSGDQPYSREAVAAAFSGIAFWVYLCLIMIVLGFLFELLSPSEVARPKTPKAYLHIINQLQSKKDLTACDESLRNAIEAEQKSRRIHRTVSMIILGISSVMFLIYALNGAHFHQSEINASMIQAMYRLIPCLAVTVGYAVFTAYHNRKSMEKEIELLKQAPAKDGKAPSVDTTADASDKKIQIFRAAFLCIGLFLLVYGFISGGTADVLTKAINICTECIGLG
ncbi:MAG: hypothetical protein IJZ23_05265 [Roseburia sp.]|nr:hypothetical protein [Roseburia sp.]